MSTCENIKNTIFLAHGFVNNRIIINNKNNKGKGESPLHAQDVP